MWQRTDALLTRLHRMAGEAERRMLAVVREAAERANVEAYIVGGSVRDLTLGRRSLDRDVTVVGDAVVLARVVARRLEAGPPVVHEPFGTATLRWGGLNLDLITARRERYAHPGALPAVEPAGLADDLARRDFTINAMALAIAGPTAGALVDPHDGMADLRRGLVRTLHDSSFRDDATRLLRATRYAGRFRFALAPETEAAARRDAGYLATISPARVRHELVRAFDEERPRRALALMERLGLPGALVEGLRFGPATLRAFGRLPRGAWEGGVVPWLLPVLRWPAARLEVYIERFALTHAEGRAVRQLPAARAALRDLAWARAGTEARPYGEPAPPSAIVARLERFDDAVLRAWLYGSPRSRAGAIARRYLDELRGVRPVLTSADLKAMGVPEGPLFGEVLRALRAARLDDPGLTLDVERRLVQHMLGMRDA